jgi:signal transduction histidine kinase
MKTSPQLHAEQEIQYLIDALPYHVLLLDSDHNILAANKVVKKDFGLDPGQFVIAYCPLAVHNRELPTAECSLMDACAKGETVEREVFDSRSGRWMKVSIYRTALITSEGKPVFMHFACEITDDKNSAMDLSRSLEHHSALCELLQNLQHCQRCSQIMEVLIDRIVSLSWLGITSTAVGFLVRDQDLRMIAQRHISPWQMKSCEHLALGDCLCGKVAQTGKYMMCSSNSRDHSIRYEEMEDHRHIILPVSHEERVLGVLALYIKIGDEMSGFQLDFLKAAAAAAGAALAGQLARENAKRIREKSIARVISFQDEERKRIARALHDQVCESLSIILQNMQENAYRRESPKGIQQDCEARIRGLIGEVRRMASQLRPTVLDDCGLESALSRNIAEISAANSDLAIHFEFVSALHPEKRLPAEIEVGLYRVTMEALVNVLAHASAAHANVVILWQPEKVMLLVEDDGCGFDYPGTRKDIDRSLGLLDMEERVTLLGGSLRIESTPLKGTSVRAEIPLEIIN